MSDPPPRVWRDWALLGFFIPSVLLEGLLRTDVSHPPAVIVLSALVQLSLLWRRTHPLAMVAIAFGAINGYDVLARINGWSRIEIFSVASVLLLLYALFRWGSGRHAALGTGIALGALIVGSINDGSGTGDVVGGAIVLVLPALLGAVIRYMSVAGAQQLDQVKSKERELLARELHDSVAHHVSAIAIQAQAGLFLARSDSLEGAISALEVIEEQSSRTLEEMRSMVEVLRRGDEPVDLAPQRGVGQIELLANVGGSDGPAIEVARSGDLKRLAPSVDAALYRLSQEAITNAIRHAKQATRIEVRIHGLGDHVELTVVDDGVGPATVDGAGYGIVGMKERASLLGGTLTAGPSDGQGWVVRALLPRQRASS